MEVEKTKINEKLINIEEVCVNRIVEHCTLHCSFARMKLELMRLLVLFCRCFCNILISQTTNFNNSMHGQLSNRKSNKLMHIK